METYSPGKIEKKWQEFWAEKGLYRGENNSSKPKYYVLVEFPYPSGERLHVGHARSYNAFDCLARYKRMKGYNVLFPLGWDAFGLPAENYALKTGIHPSITTKENIAKARAQAQSWGLSFDWSREINTTDPAYYGWTQWIFLQLFKKDLAYLAEIPVNWCPKDKINLANEEVIEGKCERCGTKTERRRQKQWLLRITRYADRLLDDLELVDYEGRIAKQQIEWIGRKEGINITYAVEGTNQTITVFTTRPETNFGAAFVVVAPEHEFVSFLLSRGQDHELVDYVEAAKNKSEMEKIIEARQKTGVFSRFYAINPLTNRRMPIWVSDFVLSGVGTGALVGVPGHDQRDFEFARQFDLTILRVVQGPDGETGEIIRLEQVQEASGTMVNSGFLDGLNVKEASQKMIDYLEEKGWGKRTVSYHLRDWVFSRQHYWGEPIPVIYCHKCLENSKIKIQKSKPITTVENGIEYAIVPVPEDQLPVELPYVENYKPTETGESPLSQVHDWVEVTCPVCGGPARRETDTMPNWAGSSWYYLAYLIADQIKNSELRIQNSQFKSIFSENKNILDYWLPVDWYNGGMEHTTLHLLYSRFWHKFLYDLGVVATPEPYTKRTSHGVVLGPDGARMSKSKGNVVNPDEIVAKFGADSLRLYEMFMGPFADQVAWNMNGVAGVYRFLNRIFSAFQKGPVEGVNGAGSSGDQRRREIDKRVKISLAKLSQKVAADIEALKFNTAIAAMMEFTNVITIHDPSDGQAGWQLTIDQWEVFLRILAPFGPHLAEELWQELKVESGKWKVEISKENSFSTLPASAGSRVGGDSFQLSTFVSVHQQPWPVLKIEEEETEAEVEIIVQVDGKLRATLKGQKSELRTQNQIEEAVLKSEKIKKYLDAKDYKLIFVPGKLINFVTRRWSPTGGARGSS